MKARNVLLVMFSLLLLSACGPKTAPLSGMPPAQAPQWKPGDYWEFTSKSRSPFALAERMQVQTVGEELVLIGNEDPNRKLRLDKDLCVKESSGTLLKYSVASGKDAYIFFPLAVGATQSFQQSTSLPKGTQGYINTVIVEAAEELTVPAGTFKTFRIRVNKKNDTGWSGFYVLWYAPEVGYFVRIVDTHSNITELVKYGRK